MQDCKGMWEEPEEFSNTKTYTSVKRNEIARSIITGHYTSFMYIFWETSGPQQNTYVKNSIMDKNKNSSAIK
jgi:hypothetical protein